MITERRSKSTLFFSLFFGDVAVFSINHLNPALAKGAWLYGTLDCFWANVLGLSVDPPKLLLH